MYYSHGRQRTPEVQILKSNLNPCTTTTCTLGCMRNGLSVVSTVVLGVCHMCVMMMMMTSGQFRLGAKNHKQLTEFKLKKLRVI
jgi:hypothetical protein